MVTQFKKSNKRELIKWLIGGVNDWLIEKNKLRQRHICEVSCFTTLLIPVSTQCNCQTDTSIFYVRARHTVYSGTFTATGYGILSSDSIDFKLTTVLVYRCLNGLAPLVWYLSDYIQRIADTDRRRLRLSSSSFLAAGDSTQTAFHRRWPCVSGGW